MVVGAGDPTWLPARPGLYTTGGRVRLLRSPLDGGRVYLCDGPIDADPLVVAGTVTAVGSGTVTVTTLGGSYVLPCASSTYAAGQDVHVVRDPARFGAPSFVLGPSGTMSNPRGTTPSGGSSNPTQTVKRQATISPQWSGTYRTGHGWDRWNTDRYGGRSTLWQGSEYGSNLLIGLATYGNQIVNLRAASIQSIVATVTRADSSVSTGRAPTLRGSAHGSKPGGAPSSSGATSSGSAVAPGKTTRVTLDPSTYNDFRTGDFKGIALVGGAYGGFAGTSRGDGMALTIQYTVEV